jgi:DNA-binding Lrp family transcriptional regulator
MTTKAYLLIETSVGASKEVLSKIAQLDGVKSADPVTGPYDIITVVERQDLDGIASLVTEEIGSIDGISRNVTCVAINIT